MAACTRCRAPLRWCFTTKGKKIPLNPEPDPAGNMVVIKRGHGLPDLARSPELGEEALPRYKAHWATCPNADEFRKPPPRAA